MSFGDETGDYSSIYHNFQSVDSRKLNQKLNIEETYAEINKVEEVEKEFRDTLTLKTSSDSGIVLPEYAVIDINKKREARLRKSMTSEELKKDDLVIYEDVGNFEKTTTNNEDSNIYELVGHRMVQDQNSTISSANFLLRNIFNKIFSKWNSIFVFH